MRKIDMAETLHLDDYEPTSQWTRRFWSEGVCSKKANWINTGPTKAFFQPSVFCDPDRALFDKTSMLADIEQIAAQ